MSENEENKKITEADCFREININLAGMIAWPPSGQFVWDGHYVTADEAEIFVTCLQEAIRKARNS